ncbi:MAG: efflux RND transporter periplasmic adaptor subunit [Gammaproteobacteria bacterium]|nr:efflux RND transporter periplasmic adaptor subunit [Gammaproteobacteria bacterium]
MLKHISHHRIWYAVITLIVILFSVALYNATRPNVEYLNPRYGEIIEAIYGLGKVKTDRFHEIKLGIVSTVDELFVREGDQVKKGDKLVRMEGGTIFRAPFSGTITLIAFREMQPVFPQQTILRLEDLSDKYIEVSLEQQGALRVNEGQAVRVVFESVRGEVLHGKGDALFPRNEEFLIHVAVQGLDDNVLPGMTADVAIEVGRKVNALLIPLSGISSGRVRILRNEKTLVVPLKIGGVDGNWAEVIEGDISPADQVIVQKRDE